MEEQIATDKTVPLEKLHDERKMWQERIRQKGREKEQAIASVKKVTNILIGSMVKKFGEKIGDEYVLKTDIPAGLFAVGAEKKDDKYIIRCKEFEEPIE